MAQSSSESPTLLMVNTCITFCGLIAKVARDLPSMEPPIVKRAESCKARVTVLLHPIKTLASHSNLTPEQDSYAVSRLAELQKTLKLAAETLEEWDGKNQKFRVRILALFCFYITDGDKKLTMMFDELDSVLTNLNIDLLLLHSTRDGRILSNPEDLVATVEGQGLATVPPQVKHAVRVLKAMQMEKAGGEVKEFKVADLGPDVSFKFVAPGLELGENTSPEFRNCLFLTRAVFWTDVAGEHAKDSKRIAALLHDPTAYDDEGDNGLLRCLGYVRRLPRGVEPGNSINLIFKLPPLTQTNPLPRTLRSLLTVSGNQEPLHDLGDRLSFSIQLARAVSLVHSASIVHKNIRPDSILILEQDHSKPHDRYPHKLGQPYLVAFGDARSSTSNTTRSTFNHLPLGAVVYHHPRQLNPHRTHAYHMLDDIYSFGVCLLEIGLWTSFFEEKDGDYIHVKPSGVVSFEDEMNERLDPFQVQANFIKLARERIPPKMGRTFCDVVVTCLDSWNGSFGRKEAETEDTSFISIKFCELVLDRLTKMVY